MPGETGTFTMTGARAVLELFSGAIHLEQQVSAIESAVLQAPNLAFDLAKTLVETCCKTVMVDRGHTAPDRADLPRLLKDTLGLLQLAPDGHVHGSEITESLRRTAGGLQMAIQGICEIRNLEGFASHGRDAYSLPLEAVQAEMVARAADAVVCFLFRVHKGYSDIEAPPTLQLGDHPEFNAYLDENNSVEIEGLPFQASEVLFTLDQEAYRDLLVGFEGDAAGEGSGDERESAA